MFGFIKKIFIVLLASIANASNHIKYVSLSNEKRDIEDAFLIYISLYPVKNFTLIHLQLNQTNMLEVVTLSVTCLIKYMLQIKHNI